MKYVILRSHTNDLPAVVFSVGMLTHKQLADSFSATHAPASAGFCEPLADGSWRTFGSSMSLCLSPAPDDASFIAAFTRAAIRTAA